MTPCLVHLHSTIALEKWKKRYTQISKLKKFWQVMLYSGLEAMASLYSTFPCICHFDEICQAFYLCEFAIVNKALAK